MKSSDHLLDILIQCHGVLESKVSSCPAEGVGLKDTAPFSRCLIIQYVCMFGWLVSLFG